MSPGYLSVTPFCFQDFWIIFIIIILNSFSGRFLVNFWILNFGGFKIDEIVDTEQFLGGSTINHLPAMQALSTAQEMWVRSLCQEDSLVKEMATQPSILG